MTEYLERYLEYPGGVAMQVLVKGNSFFTTSHYENSVSNGFHFRAASNSKTFTAAAVLLLHQQGRLNIEHCLIDNIPCTRDRYLPYLPIYAIPHKSSITLLDLMRHRAGDSPSTVVATWI